MGTIDMNDQTKQRIADLPNDAPDSAVIAVWAGLEVKKTFLPADVSSDFFPADNPEFFYSDIEYTESFCWHDLGEWTRSEATSEHTLRRWLLDGGLDVFYGKLGEDDYTVSITDGIAWHDLPHGAADSPETAFQAAVAQFASALKETSRDD